MREITKIMINDFKIMKFGIDFMGYEVKKKESLSFHHLVVPRRLCEEQGLGEGYLYWNGAILVQETSHNYLHIIEKTDRDIFKYITNEMIDMNLKGSLELENLKNISDALKSFEVEHNLDRDRSGRMLIKREYYRRKL